MSSSGRSIVNSMLPEGESEETLSMDQMRCEVIESYV